MTKEILCFGKIGDHPSRHQSHPPVKRTLAQLGIPKITSHRRYDRHPAFGEVWLEDRRPHPGRVWNRIPDEARVSIVDLTLEAAA